MPLVPPVINTAMDAAFVAGMQAMTAFSTGDDPAREVTQDQVIAAGAAAFAALVEVLEVAVLEALLAAAALAPVALVEVLPIWFL